MVVIFSFKKALFLNTSCQARHSMETPVNQSKVYIERDRNGLYGLHVSNIAPESNENDLRGLFHTSGFIKICKIIKAADNNRVAFVKFASHEEASAGLKKVNGTKIGDYTLDVRPAYESQRWKAHKQSKEKTDSSESLTKDVNGQAGFAYTKCNADTKEYRKAERKKETAEKKPIIDHNKPKDNQVPRSYILPAASQDIRYSCNGSSSSLSSMSDKTPLKPATFNKVATTRGKDKQTMASHEAQRKDGSLPHTGHVTAKTDSHSKVHLPSLESPVTKQMNGRSVSNHVTKWSVTEVVSFFQSQEKCSESMISFINEQEIDGNALMLIEESSLLHFMKLGPALKFLNVREKLKY